MTDKELKQLFQKQKASDQTSLRAFDEMVPTKVRRLPLRSWPLWSAVAAAVLLVFGLSFSLWQGNEESTTMAEQYEAYPSDAFNLPKGSSLSDWQGPSDFSNPNDNTSLTNWESPTDFLLTLE